MRRRNKIQNEVNDSHMKSPRVLKIRQQYKAQHDLLFLGLIIICLGTCLLLVLQFSEVEKINPKIHIVPRAVMVHNDALEVSPISSIHFTYNTGIINDDDGCQPLVPWEQVTNLNCNTFHEIDLVFDSTKLVNHGYIREVWNVMDDSGSVIALKTLIHTKSFSESNLEGQATDAKISDELIASRHVANIYGYCAFSGIYDFSFAGSLDGKCTIFSIHQVLGVLPCQLTLMGCTCLYPLRSLPVHDKPRKDRSCG